ncbi:PREDICTED: uncharacterized protein LOC107162820 [Diuraphis noxia]|uniref:uncharacterized protein LOC107162820 n=1 Tax=Diuraphis noxia TaxID=143948 RepID=UPI0007639B2C|nr:PREDICTED: uncharacterized protein LOC107162820 [Diuraphis noxia]
MSFVYAFRTMDVVLLVACSCTFFGEFHTTSAAVPYQDDAKELIINQLAQIIKDQNYRMRNNLQDPYPIPLDQIDDDKRAFTYDLASHLPEINTGNQEIPFAVLPNDRRYYQPGSWWWSAFDVYNFSTNNNNLFDCCFPAKAAGVGLAVLVVLLISSIACYRMQKNNKATADIEYPAYGITGPNKDMSPTGDRRLAQSAQMYHYQHQKQQIIAMETNSSVKESRCGSVSDPDSDDDNEEGDYTVYECPGLAPAGEMEVKNPLFLDDNTPASPNAVITSKDNIPGNGVIPTAPVP